MTWRHEPEKRVVKWEFVPRGLWYVVEHDGMLRTGPFRGRDDAKQWFRKELDVELVEDEEKEEERKGRYLDDERYGE